MKFDADSMGLFFVGKTFLPARFKQFFLAAPSVLASLDSYESDDNAHLRYEETNFKFITLTVEEDTTQDVEPAHTRESVAYLAIEGTGPLTALTTSVVDAQTSTFRIDIDNSGRVHDVNVNLDLYYSRTEELDLILEAPDGTSVELLSNVGGDGDSFTATILDDEAVESISSATAPFTGRFKPEGMLSDFDGQPVKGTWTLHIADRIANAQRGALAHWSLEIELAPEFEGNLNHDSKLDATDIDLLYANLGSTDPTYDMDRDGDADRRDVKRLIEELLGKRFGDVNLDQRIDVEDANMMIANFDPLGTHPHNGWTRGDFNGDGDVDIGDFIQLARNYAPPGYAPPSVPVAMSTRSLANRPSDVTTLSIAFEQYVGTEGISMRFSSEETSQPEIRSRAVRRSPDIAVTPIVEQLIVDDYFHVRRQRFSVLPAIVPR